MVNLCYNMLFLFGKALQQVLFGPLRAVEIQVNFLLPFFSFLGKKDAIALSYIEKFLSISSLFTNFEVSIFKH